MNSTERLSPSFQTSTKAQEEMRVEILIWMFEFLKLTEMGSFVTILGIPNIPQFLSIQDTLNLICIKTEDFSYKINLKSIFCKMLKIWLVT